MTRSDADGHRETFTADDTPLAVRNHEDVNPGILPSLTSSLAERPERPLLTRPIVFPSVENCAIRNTRSVSSRAAVRILLWDGADSAVASG